MHRKEHNFLIINENKHSRVFIFSSPTPVLFHSCLVTVVLMVLFFLPLSGLYIQVGKILVTSLAIKSVDNTKVQGAWFLIGAL